MIATRLAPGTDLPQQSLAALTSRLRAVADVLLPPSTQIDAGNRDLATAGQLLEELLDAIGQHNTDDRVWLLLTALSAAFPGPREVEAARRMIEFDDPLDVALYLLDDALSRVQLMGEPLAELDVVIGAVVTDVHHSAKYNLHTGIQRVARNLLPVWQRDHAEVVPAAWTSGHGALRRLDEREAERVLDWPRRGDAGEPPQPAVDEHVSTSRVVVPWRSVVVLVEVPAIQTADRVAGLGLCSGNRLVAIGYDAIPIVSADMVPPVESMKFTRYLTVIKAAARVAGISASATEELAGFTRMLPTQGLRGPVVSEVSLPSPSTPDGPNGPPISETPMVLAVGSHEPRKNHLAVLHAAEVLWREGLVFDLEFIGGSGWGEEFPRRSKALIAAGRPIRVRKGVADADLDAAYRSAAFTVFPSLHEGYGLPVAESFAHGTPVITSNFGSTAEIAAGGGALVIDPRDDAQLISAMRRLLTDRALAADLRGQIARRPASTWQDYADELWRVLVDPELDAVADLPDLGATDAG